MGLRPKQRAPKLQSRGWRLVGLWLLTIKTRDFINLAELGLTFLDAYWVIYLGMLIGGVITARNNPGGGATLRVSFPLPSENRGEE